MNNEIRDSEIRISRFARSILMTESVGFFFAIAMVWFTELYDPPFNWPQVVFISIFLAVLGISVAFLTWYLLRTIKHLEGNLVLCAGCKNVFLNGAWMPIEDIIKINSKLAFAHRVCPSCYDKLYATFESGGSKTGPSSLG